ncbi:unnamed protein product [Symbiodinium natans]|uniref:Uncharacterized protein n=1 Tax=Symbiodinium natans TaxID=878477 RepID=A0A812U3D2_9DINO|nr:unnamed protein product [Symbiodinium natans]
MAMTQQSPNLARSRYNAAFTSSIFEPPSSQSASGFVPAGKRRDQTTGELFGNYDEKDLRAMPKTFVPKEDNMSARRRKQQFLCSQVLPASNYPAPVPEARAQKPNAGYVEDEDDESRVDTAMVRQMHLSSNMFGRSAPEVSAETVHDRGNRLMPNDFVWHSHPEKPVSPKHKDGKTHADRAYEQKCSQVFEYQSPEVRKMHADQKRQAENQGCCLHRLAFVAMLFQWEQFFWSYLVLGPYLMTYSWPPACTQKGQEANGTGLFSTQHFVLWKLVPLSLGSLSFWIRLFAGFVALSQATTQVLLQQPNLADPANPFGHVSQSAIGLCIGTGVSGAFFCALSEPVGVLVLQLWGVYSIYTWWVVSVDNYSPPWHKEDHWEGIWNSLTGGNDCVIAIYLLCLGMFLGHACVRWPRQLSHFLAGVSGAAAGAHVTVQAIYFVWTEDGINGALVYGLLVQNRVQWCTARSSCQIFFYTFWVLVIVSLITQYFVASFVGLARPHKPFEPKKFRHPSEGNPVASSLEDGLPPKEDEEDEKEVDDPKCFWMRDPKNTWASNLATPCSTWIFLFFVVLLSCTATYAFTFFVYWADGTETNFFIGLVYVVANAFCLWSIIEFFLTTVWFHAIRLILGMPRLPRKDFSKGLPKTGRTILSYCLLSRQEESSEETFRTALAAHLANLDPESRITTAVVSVSSALSVVRCEMNCRDKCREEITKTLTSEVSALLQAFPKAFEQSTEPAARMRSVCSALETVGKASCHRAEYWLQCLESDWASARGCAATLEENLHLRVEDAARHFLYLHRNCKILKKPGQYQDLMVLASTGSNEAYTYLHEDYGSLGRKFRSPCFGFESNMENDGQPEEFDAACEDLKIRGREDIMLVAEYGRDAENRYYYTMVLDSDTICPPRSIRRLVETAEHGRNKSYGIINANLANDYSADDSCTWHMWRNALMEVSTVNLQRGQFWIFNRVGFYGKGLIRNDLYIPRLIGRPGSVIEALPIDILSHDTVEAKLLQPAIDVDVTLYEDVARNPISAMSQSTRWMLGEVRNCCYHASGIYTPMVKVLAAIHSLATKWELPKKKYVRWRDVPCATSAEYLSHTGFRLFHAGPGILLINLFSTVLASNDWGLQLNILPLLGFSALLFTVLALFIIPKGFLILDKLPSLRLGRYCLLSRKASKIGDGKFGDPDEKLEKDISSQFLFIGGQDASDSDSSSSSYKKARFQLSRCSVLSRQLALSVIEIVLSILLYSPELILGVLRVVRAVWAQSSGSASWKPQDAVEREVEQNLSLWYVFKKTWVVFLCGVAYMTYIIVFQVKDLLVWLIVVPWILYPLSTYAMCRRVPQSAKNCWLWTWVMDIKAAERNLL